MARHVTSAVTANGRSELITLISRRAGGGDAINFTAGVQGTFGAGTATLQISFDDGTTWIDVTNDSGTAIAFTANGARNVTVSGVAAVKDPQIELSFNLTGATP